MRVLFVSPAAELGGAERCLLDCVAALRGSGGVQVDVVALADGPLLGKARELGATAQVIEAPRELSVLGESGPGSESGGALLGLVSAAPGVIRFLARLREAIAAPQPDVVHSNGMKAHLLAGLVSPVRARLVIHLHDFIGARRASKWLLPALSRIRRRAVFIANSRAVAQDFARIAPEANVHAVYNVVDTDYFREGVAEPDWLAALADLEPPVQDTTTFGLVATYARWKGHRLFIEAAGQVCNARPDLPLAVLRSGWANLQNTRFPSARLRAPRARSFSGYRVALRARSLSGRHCSRVPSLECRRAREHPTRAVWPHHRRSHGLRTPRDRCARRRSHRALRRRRKRAFGFEPGNAAELARTMMRDLDPGVRARLGRSARDHAVAGFGRSRLAPELLRVYADRA